MSISEAVEENLDSALAFYVDDKDGRIVKAEPRTVRQQTVAD